MTPRRGTRLTRRGWVAVAVSGTVALGGGALVLALGRGPADCTVTARDRTVALDRAQAERATAALAGVRRGAGAPSAGSLGRTLHLSRADADAVTAAVTGAAPAALTSRGGGASRPESDRLDARGLTGRAEAVRADVRGRFGSLPLGGFAPGGVRSGHMAGSAHYAGRALDVFFRPVTAPHQRRGWALAHYLVAHAERLRVDTVIFDGRIWTARRSDQGWRDYRVDTRGKSRAVARVLEHRDHVHVDVAD